MYRSSFVINASKFDSNVNVSLKSAYVVFFYLISTDQVCHPLMKDGINIGRGEASTPLTLINKQNMAILDALNRCRGDGNSEGKCARLVGSCCCKLK